MFFLLSAMIFVYMFNAPGDQMKSFSGFRTQCCSTHSVVPNLTHSCAFPYCVNEAGTWNSASECAHEHGEQGVVICRHTKLFTMREQWMEGA